MLFGLIEMLNRFLNVPGKVMSPAIGTTKKYTLEEYVLVIRESCLEVNL